MEFHCRISKDGGMTFADRQREAFKTFLKENPGLLLKITPIFPESKKQRNFLEGAVIPLVTHYQEHLDHRDHIDNEKVRDWLKIEFNGTFVELRGTLHKIGKSTAGRDNLQPFLERVVGWVLDNYAPPPEALDPSAYKTWRDTVRPYGGPDNYIDYLKSLNLL